MSPPDTQVGSPTSVKVQRRLCDGAQSIEWRTVWIRRAGRGISYSWSRGHFRSRCATPKSTDAYSLGDRDPPGQDSEYAPTDCYEMCSILDAVIFLVLLLWVGLTVLDRSGNRWEQCLVVEEVRHRRVGGTRHSPSARSMRQHRARDETQRLHSHLHENALDGRDNARTRGHGAQRAVRKRDTNVGTAAQAEASSRRRAELSCLPAHPPVSFLGPS